MRSQNAREIGKEYVVVEAKQEIAHDTHGKMCFAHAWRPADEETARHGGIPVDKPGHIREGPRLGEILRNELVQTAVLIAQRDLEGVAEFLGRVQGSA